MTKYEQMLQRHKIGLGSPYAEMCLLAEQLEQELMLAREQILELEQEVSWLMEEKHG